MSERTNRRSAHFAHFKGDFVPESHVPAPFRGLRRGDGAFATGRMVAGKPFRLREPVGRLYRSLRYLQIESGETPRPMAEIAREAVRRTPLLDRTP